MRLITVILASLAGFAATGCAPLHERVIDHDFVGLRATMDRSHVVCMLLVHGMGGYSVGDPDLLIKTIQTELHLQPAGSPLPVSVGEGPNGNAGSIIRQDFIGGAGNLLRIYTLYWEPLTADLKKQYLAFDDAPEITKHRLPIHNDLKQLMMNGNVPDVVLYGGEFRLALQRSVKVTLKQIQKDLGDEKNYEYFFVTFSLGSKIVFDVVDEMDNEADHAQSGGIVDKTASFFMLANQLPLLGLAGVQATSKPADYVSGTGYETMMRFARRKHIQTRTAVTTRPAVQPSTGELAIIAVCDPNDLFSYTIPPYVREQFPATFINVQLSVAKTGYYVPTYGYLANPLTAHTGYGHDPDVIKLIIDGGKATGRK